MSGAASREIRGPQVYAAPQPLEGKAGSHAALAQKAAAPQAEEIRLSSSRAGRPGNTAARLLSASGLILAVMLPAVLIFLAVTHHGALSPQVDLLFFPGPAAEVAEAGDAAVAPALSFFIYALLTALGALLTMLPGLTAMGLGRLLSSLRQTQVRFN